MVTVLNIQPTHTIHTTHHISATPKAGQEEYSVLRDQWMRRGGGFIVGYDIVSHKSFDRVHDFYKQILSVTQTPAEHVAIVLVGNKKDLEHRRSVSTAEGMALANKWGVPFFETSALTNENVDECFEEVGRRIDLQDAASRSSKQTLLSPNGSVYTGTAIEMPTAVAAASIPFLQGVATYSPADNAVFAEYSGGWRYGRKHGNGTLRLRSSTTPTTTPTTTDASADVVVGCWADGILLEAHYNIK
eukprot:TRINITY_DN3802_c0_g1_i1.p1 TRINITY_DN3802_c0_g1~~TRINITY_DN3802_c0_g1_i1.p1  ORF type:complete len:245 (-),score=50.92 TRINITY_DN3802_c0_g1_i1:62-796(-)